jgi:hypothetical protein
LQRKSKYFSNSDWRPDGVALLFGRMHAKVLRIF